MKLTILSITISTFLAILPGYLSASESSAFDELCESFNNCPNKEPEVQTQVIIQQEIIHVEVPAPQKAVETTPAKVAKPDVPDKIQPSRKQHVFNNNIVNIELLGLRASEDKTTLIAQFEFTNQLDKTIWLYYNYYSDFLLTDANAKIWKLTNATGITGRKTRFTPKSSSKGQMIFTLNEAKELTDPSKTNAKPPFFITGKLYFSTEKMNQHVAFGFDNISTH